MHGESLCMNVFGFPWAMGIGWSQRLQINEANQQHQEHFLLRSLIPVIIISIEIFRGNSVRFYSYFFTGGRG